MATTNTLRLKVGGKYKTRDGRVAEVLREDTSFEHDSTYRWAGIVTDHGGETRQRAWRYDGNYILSGGHAGDLVEEIVSTSKLVIEPGKRYLTRDGRLATITEVCHAGIYRVEGEVDGHERCWTIFGEWYEGQTNNLDLISEISEISEVTDDSAPAYRYFRWANNPNFPESRWRSRGVGVEYCPGTGDWKGSAHEDLDSLLRDDALVECDAFGNLPQTPDTPPPADLSPASRTRIAKLAARIVLADGPVLTVDKLAGMTVAELVEAIVECDPYDIRL